MRCRCADDDADNLYIIAVLITAPCSSRRIQLFQLLTFLRRRNRTQVYFRLSNVQTLRKVQSPLEDNLYKVYKLQFVTDAGGFDDHFAMCFLFLCRV